VVPGGYLGGQKFQFDSSSGINRVAEMTAGKVLVELAELKRLIRLDPEAFKALISGTADSGRVTYGTDSFDQLRQFSFVGTGNVTPRAQSPHQLAQELLALPAELRDARKREIMKTVDAGFLVDPTGSRRFLPTMVLKYKMDLEGLRGEAVQLIAEAKALAEAADFRLPMSDDLEALRARAAGDFADTDGVEDELRAALAPVEAVEDWKIPASELKRLVGLQPMAKRGAFKSAAERMGLSCKHSSVGEWYFRGDWAKAERLLIMGGPGQAKVMAPGGSFAPG
jgi:predicted P-loop ATPase